MNDLKKKINFDPVLLYYSANNENEEEPKPSVLNKETYTSANRKYSCSVCGKRFFTNNSLKSHLEHHKPEEIASPTKKLDNWKDRRFPNKGINCNKLHCNFVALDAIEYQKHFSICEGKHITKDSHLSFCDKCAHYFSTDNHLKAHSILSHSENSSDISLREEDTKQTIPDPVFLYISEIENGIKSSPCMYPDSSVMKKRMKEAHNESMEEDTESSEPVDNLKNFLSEDNVTDDSKPDENCGEKDIIDKNQKQVSPDEAKNTEYSEVSLDDSVEKESKYNDVEIKMEQMFQNSSSDTSDVSNTGKKLNSNENANDGIEPSTDSNTEDKIECLLNSEAKENCTDGENSESYEIEEFSLSLEPDEESTELVEESVDCMEDIRISHSTPIIGNSENAESSECKINYVRKRGRKKKEKIVVTPAEDSTLNLSERSIRNRKKLVLPDFEYGYELKLDKTDTDNSDSLTESDSTVKIEPVVKKRGRPRKYPIGSTPRKPHKADSPLMKNHAVDAPQSNSKLDKKKVDKPKEFSFLTIPKPKPKHISENIPPKSPNESSVKKIHVTNESSAINIVTPVQKKPGRGRPPKKKRFLQMKSVTPSETLVAPEKRKRGRPKKIDIGTSTPMNSSKVNGQKSSDSGTGLEESPEIEIVTEHERIDDERIEEIIELNVEDAKEITKELESLSKLKVRPVQENCPTPVLKKKRGRPRKVHCDIQKSPVLVETKPKSDPEPETDNDTVQSEEDKILKRRREFLEYMGIKDGVGDSIPKKKADYKTNHHLKKGGRRSREEILKNREITGGLKKSDDERPYSIYNKYRAHSENLMKRKLKPKYGMSLSHKKLKECDVSPSGESSSIEKTIEPEGDSVIATCSENQELNESSVEMKKPKKPRKVLKALRSKKSDVENCPAIDMSSDETKNIDPDLYLADIRSRAKYHKIFKKITDIPKHNEYFPNSFITCGRCKKLMTLRHYYVNHQISHYFLCWLDGEKEMDMTDDIELAKILQPHVNADAVRNKWIRLHCEKCCKVMKSVIGYVSHIRFCSQGNEADLLGTCLLCGKRLKPSSLRHHYVKFHDISQPNMSAKKAEELCNEAGNSTSAKIKKSFKQGFERMCLDKADVIRDEEFWASLKTSYDLYMCMGLNCRHMTLSKDDLKTHILSCGAVFCEYSCQLCAFKTKYESEIIYHSKNSCKDFSDSEEIMEAEDKGEEGRRVSTRVKKVKRNYYDDFFDTDCKKRKEDDDSYLSENEDSISDFDGDSDDDIDLDLKERKSRSQKKKAERSTSASVDDVEGLRNAFISYIHRKCEDPLTVAMDTKLKIARSTSTTAVVNLKVDVNEWEMFPITDLSNHSPLQFKSMGVTFDSQKVEYDLFQSDVIKNVPVGYTGGPIWAMSWAPLPPQVTEQHLAIANLKHMNQLVEVNSSIQFPSLIQIWKFNSLDNISNAIDKPILACGIAHKFGAVWSMEWCPYGGYDETSTPSRLGILALATSSGVVPVYSVPKLDRGGELKNIVANPKPDLFLKTKHEGIQCTRITWLRNTSRSVICGGLSNGVIVLWDIGTTSSILKKGKEIYPYRTFEAHNAAITALDAHWIQNGRFLLTSSVDRIIKYWDLEDLTGPMYEFERATLTTCVSWFHQWAVNAVTTDAASLIDRGAFLCNARDVLDKRKSLPIMKDTYWSAAYSEWNDLVAVSSCSGQVSVVGAKRLPALTYKHLDFEKVITETQLLQSKEDEWEKESVEARTGLPETKSPYDCTSVIQDFIIKFCDRVSNSSITHEFIPEPDTSTVNSINKVCWNQNYNNFNWLAVGYECGFFRVFRVERFDKLRLTKFYKTNETSSHLLI